MCRDSDENGRDSSSLARKLKKLEKNGDKHGKDAISVRSSYYVDAAARFDGIRSATAAGNCLRTRPRTLRDFLGLREFRTRRACIVSNIR